MIKEIGEVMNIDNMLRKNKGRIAAVILVVVILLPIGYYAIGDTVSQTADPFLLMPDPQYTECVKDTKYMRFHHMDLLKEIREETVREGIRGDIHLADCRKCHEDRNQFCNRCHNIVNLNLDCFGCHNYPETPQEPITAQAHGSQTNTIVNVQKSGF